MVPSTLYFVLRDMEVADIFWIVRLIRMFAKIFQSVFIDFLLFANVTEMFISGENQNNGGKT